jgi:hypothetical protein
MRSGRFVQLLILRGEFVDVGPIQAEMQEGSRLRGSLYRFGEGQLTV